MVMVQQAVPRAKELFPSVATVLVKLLFKLVLFDTAHYMQSIRPSLNEPKGDTIFDPTMSPIPRYALAAFLGTCTAVVIYTTVDGLYHFSVASSDNPSGPGHRSPTAPGRPLRSSNSGASAGTSSSATCSSYTVPVLVAHC
jgi:hypothetical protein